MLQNVKAILDDQGLTFANVVKSTVFLTNLADFAGDERGLCEVFHGEFPGALDHAGGRAAQRRERGNRSHRAFLTAGSSDRRIELAADSVRGRER